MFVNYSKFASFCGVTRQAIYKALKDGLVENENNKLNLNNPTNKNYIFSHGKTENEIKEFILDQSEKKEKKVVKIKDKSVVIPEKKEIIKEKKTKVKVEKKPKINDKKEDFSDDDFENISGLPAKMMKLTLRQLVMRYGNQMMLKNYADILNKMMMASERDQKIQIRKLELIEKDFVISRIFSYLETLHNQVFNIPLPLSDELIAVVMAKKENARTEIIDKLKLEFEKLLKDCKNRISNELDNLKSKFEIKDENEE